MECLRWRIVFQFLCKCVGKFSGWAADAAQKLCCCASAFHTPLPCHQHRLNFFIFCKPVRIDHAADIHNDCHLREQLLHLFHHRALFLRQVKVSVWKNALCLFQQRICLYRLIHLLIIRTLSVPAFPGKTADADHCRVRVRSRFFCSFFRKRRLYCHSRFCSCLVLFFYLFTVIIRECLIHFYFFRQLLESLIQICRISNGYISASATTLDIVKTAFSKQGEFGACLKWEKAFIVL